MVATSSSYCLLIGVVHRNLLLKSLNDILTISLIPSRLYPETFLTTTLHYVVSNLKYQNYSLIEELQYSRYFHGEGGVIFMYFVVK